ncbi:MAG: cation:proton antiporter, partial [Bacteroidota bacterium]
GMQLVGGLMITGLIIYLLKKEEIKLPFDKTLKDDHELQVFGGLIICFMLSLFTSFFELSAGLGAFVAGLFVHASTSAKWLHDTLHPFRVVLISIFFLSVGMLIDLNFLMTNWQIISLLVVAVLLGNQGINAVALKLLGNSTKESLYGGALLAQIGEFSFVLASIGFHSDLISLFSYQLTIIVISITIFASPIWSGLTAFVLKLDIQSLR